MCTFLCLVRESGETRGRAEDAIYPLSLQKSLSRDSHTQALWFFSKILLYLFTAVVDSRANPYSMKDAESRREAAGSRTLVQIKASTCI